MNRNSPPIQCTRLRYLTLVARRTKAKLRQEAYSRMVSADPAIHKDKHAGKRMLASVAVHLTDDELFMLATEAARIAESRIDVILEIAERKGLLT